VMVRILKRAGCVGSDPDSVVHRKLLFTPKAVTEGFAFDIRHREPQLFGSHAGVEDGEDVRMLQPRDQLDLAPEALGSESPRQLGVKNLECHRTIVPQVMGEIDRGHTPTSQLALDMVAIG